LFIYFVVSPTLVIIKDEYTPRLKKRPLHFGLL